MDNPTPESVEALDAATGVASEDVAEMAPSRRRRWPLIAGGLFVGLLVAWGVAYGIDHSQGPKISRSAEVGGVDIGGLSPAAAEDKLRAELEEAITAPVEVRAGQAHTRFDPAVAGIRADWQATVESAPLIPKNPVTWVVDFLRAPRPVGLATTAAEDVLDTEVQRMAAELHKDPVDATVSITPEGSVAQTPAVDGQSVDPGDLEVAILMQWVEKDGVDVDPTIVKPRITDDVASKVASGDAAHAVKAPIVAVGRDGVEATIPTARMGEVVSFRPPAPPAEGQGGDARAGAPGVLETVVNLDAARGILAEGLGPSEHPPVNARISFVGGEKTVTPHQDGVLIDWDPLMAGLREAIVSPEERNKRLEVTYRDEPAAFTTEAAQSATFDQELSSFSTGGFEAASGRNIQLTAATVNGAIVGPGETFSLNGYTGPRGTAQGYVESGIILNGHADRAVGGGVSQFATTLYNAAYFAGMEDVAHTPHSYYISRYPAGREATVFEGAIDLQFKNTSPYPVRIETFFGDGQVTVRFMGVKTVNVQSINGGRWAYTQPKRLSLSGPKCAPSSGAPGFTTSDTRVVRDLNGNELSRTTRTTVYDPSPIVSCG